jgi:hypothetical protein
MSNFLSLYVVDCYSSYLVPLFKIICYGLSNIHRKIIPKQPHFYELKECASFNCTGEPKVELIKSIRLCYFVNINNDKSMHFKLVVVMCILGVAKEQKKLSLAYSRL